VQPTLPPELAEAVSRRLAQPEGVPQANPRLLHTSKGTAGCRFGTTRGGNCVQFWQFRIHLIVTEAETSVARHDFTRDTLLWSGYNACQPCSGHLRDEKEIGS